MVMGHHFMNGSGGGGDLDDYGQPAAASAASNNNHHLNNEAEWSNIEQDPLDCGKPSHQHGHRKTPSPGLKYFL